MTLRFSHALVVGGTGMLAAATRFLAAHSTQTSLVCRNARAAAQALGLEAHAACPADWSDTRRFVSVLEPRLRQSPPDVALLWVHRTGHQSLLWLLSELAANPTRVVHVRGSAVTDPRTGHDDADAVVRRFPSLSMAPVVLGSKRNADGVRRWLTDAEISAGAIEAIASGRAVVAGEIM